MSEIKQKHTHTQTQCEQKISANAHETRESL